MVAVVRPRPRYPKLPNSEKRRKDGGRNQGAGGSELSVYTYKLYMYISLSGESQQEPVSVKIVFSNSPLFYYSIITH